MIKQHSEVLDMNGMSWGFNMLELACRASLPCWFLA